MSVHIQHRPDPRAYDKFNRAWIDTLSTLVVDTLEGQSAPRILDVGCGRGELLQGLAGRGYECHGVDFDETCVRLAGEFAETRQSSIEALPEHFEPNSFDMIVLSHVLEHTNNPGEIMEILRALTRRYIALAVPNLCSTLTFFEAARRQPRHVNAGHRQGWDPNHLLTFLECTCNLKVVRWASDRVLVPTRLGVLLGKVGVADYLEKRLLTRVFPRLSNSLIVLCEK